MKRLKKIPFVWALLNKLCLVYDPDFWAIEPPKQKERSRRTPPPAPEREDIVHTEAGSQYVKENEDGSVTYKDIKAATKRSAALSDEDLNQLMLQGLDVTGDKSIAKASEIKQLFAKEISISEMVDHFEKKGKSRGYGRTTLSKYVNAFNKAEACQNMPIES